MVRSLHFPVSQKKKKKRGEERGKKYSIPFGNPLVVQWLELRTPTAESPLSIPDQGVKILHVLQYGQKINKSETISHLAKPKLSASSCLHSPYCSRSLSQLCQRKFQASAGSGQNLGVSPDCCLHSTPVSTPEQILSTPPSTFTQDLLAKPQPLSLPWFIPSPSLTQSITMTS